MRRRSPIESGTGLGRRTGDWNVANVARNAYDLEGKVVGTLGAGRIGYRVLQRLVPFDCKELLYYDYNPLPAGELMQLQDHGKGAHTQ